MTYPISKNNSNIIMEKSEQINQMQEKMKKIIKEKLEEEMEQEMEEVIGAKKSERNKERVSYRAGYYDRYLTTRVGKIKLRVPQDRNGLFNTKVFERYQRSEKALVTALMQMYIEGVSTRKVKKITEKLCGVQFSAGTISKLNKKLDKGLNKFFNRDLEEEYPYITLDATYMKVREDSVVRSKAVFTAMGVNWKGERQILAVEIGERETYNSWKELINKLKRRKLHGVKLVISDAHEGLRRAIEEMMPEAMWQRCYVHFLRNAIDNLPRRKTGDDVIAELRWIYERSTKKEAKEALDIWIEKWEKKYSKLSEWVENNIEETMTYYRFPKQHHRNIKSTNVIERMHQELKRRTTVARIFPDKASCLRLTRAVAIEIHEYWIERSKYIDMNFLKDFKNHNLFKQKVLIS